MKKMRLTFVSVLLTGLIGCAGVIVKPGDFTLVATGETENMPTKAQLSGGTFKVILFETKDKTHQTSFSKVTISMDGEIIHSLNHASAEIVDRSMAKALKQDIDLAETGGKATYTGPVIASLAFKPTIHSSGVFPKHNQASSYTDKKGKVHHTPANCVHTGNVSGTLSLYEVPSLRLVKSINLKGTASQKTETRNTLCPIGEGQSEFLLVKAAANAVHNSAAILQDIVTPSAFVTERRQEEDKDKGKGIIVTTLGTDLGAEKCKKVVVYHVEKTTNILTGKESMHSYPIAKGRITSQLERDYSWVALSEGFDEVRIGHKLKVEYKSDFLGKFEDFVCKTFG